MQLYCISCTFQIERDSTPIEGIAICTDPDTPETFVYPDGKPYTGTDLWTYRLHHYSPWAVVQTNRTDRASEQ